MKRGKSVPILIFMFVFIINSLLGNNHIYSYEDKSKLISPYIYKQYKEDQWYSTSWSALTYSKSTKDFVPGVYTLYATNENGKYGEPIVVYCSDLITSRSQTEMYRKINLEDATYYESKDTAAHIRAILNEAYPYKGDMNTVIAHLKQKLVEMNLLTDLEAEKINFSDVISGTAQAIWAFANSNNGQAHTQITESYSGTTNITSTDAKRDGSNKSNKFAERIKKTIEFMDLDINSLVKNDTNWKQVKKLKYQSVKDLVDPYYDELGKKKVDAIIDYYTNLSPIYPTNQNNIDIILTKMDIESIEPTGIDNRDLAISLKFNGTLDSQDNVQLKVFIDGQEDVSLSLSANQFQKCLEQNNNTYSFIIKNYIDTSNVEFVVQGIQKLGDGAYFYEAQNGWKKAQSYVSYEVGSSTPISISANITSGNFSFSKTDGFKTLQNAEFELKSVNNPSIVYKATSTGSSNNNVTFNNILPGSYTLTEVIAPIGYSPSNEMWNVFVDENTGKVTIKDENGNSINSLEVVNTKIPTNDIEKRGQFSFNKTDGFNTLPGAEFELRKITPPTIIEQTTPSALTVENMNHIIQTTPSILTVENMNHVEIVYRATSTTASNNNVTFNDILPGTYKLTEIKAPVGYISSNETWIVFVDASTGEVTIEDESGNKVDTLDVVNDKNPEFVTGGNEPITEDKPGDIIIEDKPGDIVIKDEPEDIVIKDEPEDIVIKDEPKDIVIKDEPQYISMRDELEDIIIKDELEDIAMKDEHENSSDTLAETDTFVDTETESVTTEAESKIDPLDVTNSKDNNKSLNPKTGDVGIGMFISLFIASLIGIFINNKWAKN